ncbi:MAG: zinc ribbon domain-containing protein [Gemmatimonadales bacterium]
MLLEAVAAGVVGAVLLWLVLQPMVSPDAAPPIDTDPPDPEETPRGIALLALKEIEFDRATGKLSDADYAALHSRYTAAAVAAMDAAPAGVRCLRHGPRTNADARFCNECGAGLVTDTGTCRACGFAVPADAIFCPGCGQRVAAED